MGAPVFLGLGSNVGDREEALDHAVRGLAGRGVATVRRSSIWHTEPVGGPPQEWFLNQVVEGRTRLVPRELLRACLDTERELGRVRGERNGPRRIDIDILFYGDELLEEPGLVVPHPRLAERRFVLEPLHEIAPGLLHPGLGVDVSELRRRCPDTSQVSRWRRVGLSA
jgi:2-amino-4-hydroxy-6-hydroxymethyldihydropteridine diphosphokinase